MAKFFNSGKLWIASCIAIIISLQFETVLLSLGSVVIVLDEIYQNILWTVTKDLTDPIDRTCYSDKLILPSVYHYLHRYGFQVFRTKIVKPQSIKEIQINDFLRQNPIKIQHLNEPVVIRNFSYEFQSKTNDLWTVEYFLKNYGDQNLSYVVNQSCVANKYEQHRKCWTDTYDCCAINKYTVSSFIDETRYKNECLYASFQTRIVRDNPELLEAINLKYINEFIVENMSTGDLFIGNFEKQRSYTYMHGGALTNAFVQIKGTKEWKFVPPKYGPYLKPYPYYAAFEVFRFTNKEFAEMDPNIINHIPTFTVTLNPGDMLLIPPLWWHDVISSKGWNIAISLRATHVGNWHQLGNTYQHFISWFPDMLTSFRLFGIHDTIKMMMGQSIGETVAGKGVLQP